MSSVFHTCIVFTEFKKVLLCKKITAGFVRILLMIKWALSFLDSDKEE